MTTRRLLLLVLMTATVMLAAAPLAGQASAATAGHTLVWEKITNGGRFLNYDGGQNFSYHDRDWPVNLLFYRDASIRKVKEQVNLPRSGGRFWEGVRYTRTSSRRFDGDRGEKESCDSRDLAAHYRVYAPNPGNDQPERLFDDHYGYFVVATSHLDHGKTECGSGRKWHGLSERAEVRIALHAGESELLVRSDYIKLHNREPWRRDSRNTHYWENNGKATAIKIP